MDLGQNIARLRKERNLTQEQLGQALGVSGQAVSKWENGGAPDAEMLPSIADRLGVTVDALYGRSSKTVENMAEIFSNWLQAFPSEKRMDELFRLLCSTTLRPYLVDSTDILDRMFDKVSDLPVESCYSKDFLKHTDDIFWMRGLLYLDQGLQLTVPAEDCPFYLLMPEPPQGYEANLAEDERYRQLFAALSMPGALEILRYLYHREEQFYFPAWLGKATGASPEQARAALAAMENCGLVNKMKMETEAGPEDVYCLHDNGGLIPFLLLAKWVSEKESIWAGCWCNRNRPILEKGGESHA